MKARIRAARWEAPAVLSFMLEPLAGELFPPFTAGAHINVTLQSGHSDIPVRRQWPF
jgi:ferredoxin-NADP reductase